jgi:L-alanine-DL-glutamate epimerase-like enolase superfamily enzyme
MKIKIDRIEVYGYDLSYRYGKYVMSGNQVINSIPSTVVRIVTGSGIEGWGEVCPLGPLYLDSHGLGARAALQQMLPGLEGLDPTNLSSVHA